MPLRHAGASRSADRGGSAAPALARSAPDPRGVALDHVDEQRDSRRGHGADGLADAGQRRRGEARRGQVVEADGAHVVRHAQARIHRRAIELERQTPRTPQAVLRRAAAARRRAGRRPTTIPNAPPRRRHRERTRRWPPGTPPAGHGRGGTAVRPSAPRNDGARARRRAPPGRSRRARSWSSRSAPRRAARRADPSAPRHSRIGQHPELARGGLLRRSDPAATPSWTFANAGLFLSKRPPPRTGFWSARWRSDAFLSRTSNKGGVEFGGGGALLGPQSRYLLGFVRRGKPRRRLDLRKF